jgi:hypothetical protein
LIEFLQDPLKEVCLQEIQSPKEDERDKREETVMLELAFLKGIAIDFHEG